MQTGAKSQMLQIRSQSSRKDSSACPQRSSSFTSILYSQYCGCESNSIIFTHHACPLFFFIFLSLYIQEAETLKYD